MWQYNFNYLCHASYKYIDKYKSRKGNWVYVYDNADSPTGKYQPKTGHWEKTTDSKIKSNKTKNAIRPNQYAKTKPSDLAKEIQKRKDALTATKLAIKKQIVNSAKQEAERKSAGDAADERKKVKNDIKNSIMVNKAVKKTVDAYNKKFGTSYGSENTKKADEIRVQNKITKTSSADKAQYSREKEINKSVKATEASPSIVNAKKQEQERRQASNSAERAQNARQKATDESVRKTWEQRAKNEIKNKAQFDRKQDELVKLCDNLKRQYTSEDDSKNILGGKNWNKIHNQRQVAINNWETKIKDLASLLAASDVSSMDKETYRALREALYTIRAHQDAYKQGGTEAKNNSDVRNQLYYTKDSNKDLVREVEDILKEVKLQEVKTWEDVDRETTINDRKKVKTW